MLVADYIDVLKGTFLFHSLSIGETADILSMDGVTVATFKRGEFLTAFKENCSSLAIVLSGAINVYKPINGGLNFPVTKLNPGNIIGAACMFSKDKSAPNDCIAAFDSKVLMLEERTLLTLFSKYPNMIYDYLSYLTERIRFLSQKMEGFAQNGVYGKLLNYLLKNAINGVIELDMSMVTLSKTLSISRASLYRVLEDMEQSGIISREGRNIYVNAERERADI
ncbi:MAG: Crp/Fnr family transcriptional regulator [Clostridia bacterium]